MIQATFLGANLREGSNRRGEAAIYYNLDVYCEGGSGRLGIDKELYDRVKDLTMGTPLKLLLRPAVWNGRVEFRVTDAQALTTQRAA